MIKIIDKSKNDVVKLDDLKTADVFRFIHDPTIYAKASDLNVRPLNSNCNSLIPCINIATASMYWMSGTYEVIKFDKATLTVE